VGIEPMPKIREFAIARARSLDLQNVEFRDGTAEDLSAFEDDAFEVAVSMHGAPFPWDTEHAFVRGCEPSCSTGRPHRGRWNDRKE